MLIRKTTYHNDISAAYEKGLKQGFEFARKLKRTGEGERQELCPTPERRQSEESSLLVKQLVDIAGRKGIELK